MAHFYATAVGGNSPVSRTGTKNSGSITTNQSWDLGAITSLHYSRSKDMNYLTVSLYDGPNGTTKVNLPKVYIRYGKLASDNPLMQELLDQCQT